MSEEHRELRAELQLLSEGQAQANPRYVREVAGFLWERKMTRKLRNPDSLPPVEAARLHTVAELCS